MVDQFVSILKISTWMAVLAALCLVSACGPSRPVADDPLADVTQFIPNPSFEEMDGDLPRGWKTAVWRKNGEFRVDDVARTGERSVMISSETGGDLAWTAVVPVRPFARYRLSGWIKTEDVRSVDGGAGALLNIHGVSGWRTDAVTGTADWTEVVFEFDAGANDALQVNCLFGGWGRAVGAAWFDDIRLDLLEAREVKPEVRIDADRRLHPISPYIYGQFIEHLGRCIYGGIWAEMLEDRKFFDAVGAADSPWKPLGEAAFVSMDTAKPFVGVHTPRITLNGAEAGIVQTGLGVVAGKSYEGRVVLAGTPQAGPVRISFVWGEGESGRQTMTVDDVGTEFETFPLVFTAAASSDDARLEIAASGRGSLRIGTASLMPADNVEGFRPDTLALLRELDSPVYRWPGGNFVSGYDWRDGIGDRDKRPPRKNPAWLGVEHNDVGIHEFMDFCRLVEAEPFIAVNTGLGDVRMAVEQVEYVNGPPDTPMGRVRTANGRLEPWKCIWWAVGNEMYGSWQLGHMPLADYVKKHNAFAEAMRAVDPDVRLIAVGAVGNWSRTMMAECADHMDLISEHFYCAEKPGLLSHVSQIPFNVRRIAEAHREYRETIPALEGRDIRIALDEWNYWYGPYIYGELGTQYFLQDALGIAAGLHEYARQSDIIFMANYAQTVNVIGAIKTSKTEAAFDTTGLVLKLYRRHFGTIPVAVEGAPEPLDVLAAWSEDGRTFTVGIVNPTRTEQRLTLDLAGLKTPKQARLFRIEGTDPKAKNVPGLPPEVEIRETPSAPFGGRLDVPPMSISLYLLEIGN
jgi:alpha-L-arabinofuranosidase